MCLFLLSPHSAAVANAFKIARRLRFFRRRCFVLPFPGALCVSSAIIGFHSGLRYIVAIVGFVSRLRAIGSCSFVVPVEISRGRQVIVENFLQLSQSW